VTPYSPERPRGRLVKTDTGYKVEWSAVEKQDEPFDPALVPFRKGDDDGTAISAKDRIKASKKKAKQDAKNRKKANASAEAARAGLAKGESEVKDPIVTIAKTWIEGGRPPRITKKADFYRALVKLAGERYPQERPATRFAKALASGDADTAVLWKAYRLADGPEPTTADGADEPGANNSRMPETSAAYDEISRKAKKLAAREGISFEVAFSRVASARPDLMKADREAHFAKVAKAYAAP
jgi:hypothetical protein